MRVSKAKLSLSYKENLICHSETLMVHVIFWNIATTNTAAFFLLLDKLVFNLAQDCISPNGWVDLLVSSLLLGSYQLSFNLRFTNVRKCEMSSV